MISCLNWDTQTFSHLLCCCKCFYQARDISRKKGKNAQKECDMIDITEKWTGKIYDLPKRRILICTILDYVHFDSKDLIKLFFYPRTSISVIFYPCLFNDMSINILWKTHVLSIEKRNFACDIWRYFRWQWSDIFYSIELVRLY